MELRIQDHLVSMRIWKYYEIHCFVYSRTVVARRLKDNAPSLNSLPWEELDYSKVS